MKLLLVEDSLQLNKALTTVLKRNSFVVDSAFDGEEALLFIDQYKYDIIILDIMLPKVNGLEVLKIARSKKINTPIIMLTAKSTTEDKIVGLDLGADDYLPKPFNVDELLARIRALLRRKPAYDEVETLSFGDLELDINTLMLSTKEDKVPLMNKEMQIMTLLMKAKGNVVSLETISKNAWDIESYSTSRYQGYYLECQND